jgi:hypothetical protein
MCCLLLNRKAGRPEEIKWAPCTCLAHALNRIAETIRLQFPLVNALISQGKKIFLKAPLRVQIF